MGRMTKEEIKTGLALRKMAYEQGKVIGRRDAIREAIELAEDAFGNGESDQLTMRLREMLDE